MLRGRDLRALKEARRAKARAKSAARRPLRLSASAQAAVIEKLSEEFDLLCRGEPSGHDVEAALREAEAAA
jgi:hypothetical protein